MENLILYKFVEELQQQTRFARLAFRELRSIVTSVDSERIFLFAHAFLAHSANVSRLLWPTREGSAERGKALREATGVAEDSALRLPGARPQLEHEDECYEDWLERLDAPHYVDMNVMPTAAIGEFKGDAFQRSLDPDTFRLVLRGVTVETRVLADALRQLETSIDHWKRTHRPW